MLALLDMAPMEAIQTEVPPAIQMVELKQQGGMVIVIMIIFRKYITIAQVFLDQVVMQRVTVAVAVVEVVTMEVEQDGMVKVVEEDLLTAMGLYVPRQNIQSLLVLVMEWPR